jgi:glycine cleavage system H protein
MIETRYTDEHEWVRIDEDGIAMVGITDYAQDQLGDIVYVELPETGQDVIQGEEIAVIESVKTAADIKAPISGTIIGVNEELVEQPEIVNESPMDDGWVLKITPSDEGELVDLMDDDAYGDYITGLS